VGDVNIPISRFKALAAIYEVPAWWLLEGGEDAGERGAPVIGDPDLLLFVNSEWDELIAEEQEYVKVAIRMARRARLIREQREGHGSE
jgi:hypothetical protein